MKHAMLIGILILMACEVVVPEQSPMEKWARSALQCPVGTLTWSVVESGGGTIDQAGNYTSPGCTPPYVDATYHVQVAGCGNTATIPVVVADNLKSVSIYCGVVAPETCCRVPPLNVVPGAAVQFYAALQYSCAGHIVYSSPSPPPALCP